MSFFKTAKSTFMSTNDLQSDFVLQSESQQAWPNQRDEVDSELAGNADQILAGGTMSILRRKNKQFVGKDLRGRENERNKGTKFNYELLSNDIVSLLQVFQDDAANI